ncbi:unnamed protein product [Tilletia controversa]|uniref:Mitochondrial carrier protein RIM2 n=2 Tax=Tilletia TaxID=13289 RepID=A0A8X7MRQ3_9BASI|nr:hypothetical protein CF328_g4304 [Tilletia controversa]KAE8196245.1 hypothetical protein CF335_g4903 [Tilletia laevis]CAD6946432.1 unnamed protein product [Tilletia caries]KAE8245543.1 hypothetical protein A4X06_0g5616 [Tilletia controversa]CAD6902505.1 unnamed protein product [Tilletia controversa]
MALASQSQGGDGSSEAQNRTRLVPPKGWIHFVAGGVGGMCGAIITAPLDLAKTRLQSDMYRTSGRVVETSGVRASAGGVASVAIESTARAPTSAFAQVRTLAYHFVETGHLLRQIAVEEGPRALFKGLGPTLVGVIPARSINFYAYGNGKRVFAERFNNGRETPLVHLSAAAVAGVVTATATNPIWVVKTRLQLEASRSKPGSGVSAATAAATSVPRPLNSFQLTLSIMRSDGIKGMYKGLSASYLGVAEGTIQWVLYEYLKRLNGIDVSAQDRARDLASSRRMREEPGPVGRWFGTVGAAGAAKLVASLITYPHEVLRTRLRQSPPVGQKPKYTGLLTTFQVVLREEGAAALYGGLSAHLLRVVPNAIVMFSIYELTLRLTSRKELVAEERVTTINSSEVVSPAA